MTENKRWIKSNRKYENLYSVISQEAILYKGTTWYDELRAKNDRQNTLPLHVHASVLRCVLCVVCWVLSVVYCTSTYRYRNQKYRSCIDSGTWQEFQHVINEREFTVRDIGLITAVHFSFSLCVYSYTCSLQLHWLSILHRVRVYKVTYIIANTVYTDTLYTLYCSVLCVLHMAHYLLFFFERES